MSIIAHERHPYQLSRIGRSTGEPPYAVSKVHRSWYVHNSNGFNCLTGGPPLFASEELAREVCDMANAGTLPLEP